MADKESRQMEAQITTQLPRKASASKQLPPLNSTISTVTNEGIVFISNADSTAAENLSDCGEGQIGADDDKKDFEALNRGKLKAVQDGRRNEAEMIEKERQKVIRR